MADRGRKSGGPSERVAPLTQVVSPRIVDLAAEEAARKADERRLEARRQRHREADERRLEARRQRHREASRKGGLKGGRVRAARLSAERRSEIARKAARERWARSRRDSA